jgi:predicted Rossmann fold nucleotide-binding protein DprA/Smf involved in DNA uptake
MRELNIMQITSNKNSNAKYIQIYLTKEEFENKETKEVIEKYKKEKYNVAIFITGKENYPEILKKIIVKQVELNKNVC